MARNRRRTTQRSSVVAVRLVSSVKLEKYSKSIQKLDRQEAGMMDKIQQLQQLYAENSGSSLFHTANRNYLEYQELNLRKKLGSIQKQKEKRIEIFAGYTTKNVEIMRQRLTADQE